MTKNNGGNRLEKITKDDLFPGPKGPAKGAGISADGNHRMWPPLADNQHQVSQEAQGELRYMQQINTFLSNVFAFLNDKREEAGQTLVEYALIIALISLTIIGLALLVTPGLTEVFTDIGNELTGATS